MSPRVTQAMLNDAKKDGATVIKRPSVRVSGAENRTSTDPVPIPLKPKPVNNGEIEALRGEISVLREMVEDSKKAADKRVQELSAIITALSETKPVRVKPVRDLDPQSKTYLLVSHYDFIPVSYRKLDS